MLHSLDPVTYEVLRHRLWSVNEEHGLTIARISGSPIVTLSHDFNPCIHLPDGEDVFSGPYIQYLNAGASTAIEWILETFGSAFVRPGDMFLTNDPWIGVSHQLDVCILSPVHDGERLVAWVSNAVHQYDLGGTLPGSFTPAAQSIYEEASPIPPIRIVEGGRIRPDLERMFLNSSRLPDLLALDLRAGIGGCNVAGAAILEAIAAYGLEAVDAAMHKIVDDAEAAFVDRLSAIPNGRWSQEYFIEARKAGVLRLRLSLEKDGSTLRFANPGDPQQDAAQSMTAIGFEGAAVAAVAAALCNDQLFAVGGAARRIEFDLEPGTVGNALPPAPMSCANMRVAQLTSIASHVVAKMVACGSRDAADAVGAGASAGLPVLLISGKDASGNPYGTALSDHMAGGVAPSSHRDGVDSGGHSWDPRSLVPNVEDQELVFPILYLYRHELPDSGGAGFRRGANGGAFAYLPLGVDEITVATVTAGAATKAPPTPGLAGGLPSATSGYSILPGALADSDGNPLPSSRDQLPAGWETIPSRSSGIRQGAADAVEERWCGSGGLGDPLEREPELVTEDLLDERILPARAENTHGVIIRSGSVDEAATLQRRDDVRRERLATSAEPTVSVTAEAVGAPIPAGPHLNVLPTEAGQVWACMCGQPLADATDDYRRGCRSRVSPVADTDAGRYIGTNEGLELHEFFCPSCARMLSTDVVLPGTTPERDIELFLD